MADRYTWGVDGYGRQFIVNQNDVLVMCCLPGAAKYYELVLMEQDDDLLSRHEQRATRFCNR